jgi:hypothetical protein
MKKNRGYKSNYFKPDGKGSSKMKEASSDDRDKLNISLPLQADKGVSRGFGTGSQQQLIRRESQAVNRQNKSYFGLTAHQIVDMSDVSSDDANILNEAFLRSSEASSDDANILNEAFLGSSEASSDDARISNEAFLRSAGESYFGNVGGSRSEAGRSSITPSSINFERIFKYIKESSDAEMNFFSEVLYSAVCKVQELIPTIFDDHERRRDADKYLYAQSRSYKLGSDAIQLRLNMIPAEILLYHLGLAASKAEKSHYRFAPMYSAGKINLVVATAMCSKYRCGGRVLISAWNKGGVRQDDPIMALYHDNPPSWIAIDSKHYRSPKTIIRDKNYYQAILGYYLYEKDCESFASKVRVETILKKWEDFETLCATPVITRSTSRLFRRGP